jgi:DNA polymerase III subunit delta'
MQFSKILSQEPIKQRLIRSARENRISHAQMFLGPEGSGSLPLAIAYAQYILCRNKQENDACGACPSCLKATKLEHPDLHFSFPIVKERDVKKSDDLIAEFRKAFLKQPYMNLRYWYSELDAEAKTGIIPTEEAGSIIHKLNYKSYEGEYKILIMWMPELMNPTASNNLLKIIEEPPDQTLFILVAENQENILPTILSRTQLIKIPRLEDSVIMESLTKEHDLSSEDASNFAMIAEGNYWLAVNLVTEVEDSGYNMETFRQWMLLCHRKNISGLLNWAEEIAGMNREQQRNFLKYALHIFRQCIIGTYSDNELLRVRDEERDFISKFSQFVHGYNIVPLSEAFNKAHYHIERNGNPKLVFVNLSFRVTTLMFPKK